MSQIVYMLFDCDDTLVNTTNSSQWAEGPRINKNLINFILNLKSQGKEVRLILITHQDIEIMQDRINRNSWLYKTFAPHRNFYLTVAWNVREFLANEISIDPDNILISTQCDLYLRDDNNYQVGASIASLKNINFNDKESVELWRDNNGFIKSETIPQKNKELQLAMVTKHILASLGSEETATVIFIDDDEANVSPATDKGGLPTLEWVGQELPKLKRNTLTPIDKMKLTILSHFNGIDGCNNRIRFIGAHYNDPRKTLNVNEVDIKYDTSNILRGNILLSQLATKLTPPNISLPPLRIELKRRPPVVVVEPPLPSYLRPPVTAPHSPYLASLSIPVSTALSRSVSTTSSRSVSTAFDKDWDSGDDIDFLYLPQELRNACAVLCAYTKHSITDIRNKAVHFPRLKRFFTFNALHNHVPDVVELLRDIIEFRVITPAELTARLKQIKEKPDFKVNGALAQRLRYLEDKMDIVIFPREEGLVKPSLSGA